MLGRASPHTFCRLAPCYLRCSKTRAFSSSSPLQSRPAAKPRILTLTQGLGILAALTSAYVVAHLEEAPVTGRLRMMTVSSTLERKMAEEAHHHAQQEFAERLLAPNHVLSRHIRRVVDNLLQSNALGKLRLPDDSHEMAYGAGSFATRTKEELHGSPDEIEWELFVVNDNRVANARATYGTIVVFTGILGIAKDEQGLAAILGHEIGHVVARHQQEQISLVKPLLVFESLLSKIVDLNQGLPQQLAQWARAPLSINSRQQEIEADTIGMMLMARACYDPQAALDVLERIFKLERSHAARGKRSFFSTHPTFPERIQALEKILPAAYTLRKATPICSGLLEDISSFHVAQDNTIS